MSRRQLTQKQHAFLQYLIEHMTTHRVWPTYREIVDHFGYRSPNSVTQNLQALTRKGFLERHDTGYDFVERVQERARGIPLGGRIADGEVEQAVAPQRVALNDLVPDLGAVRAYEIGDQPVEHETLAGSTHILLGQGRVQRGEIGVVLLDGRLTLRRVYRDPADGWRLEALNGKEVTNHAAPQDNSVQLLGPYAGHAGPFGLVRDPLAFMHPDNIVADPDHEE